MARPEALRLLRIARRDLRMARRLLAPLPLRAFTTFAVQYRYDDEPEELSLDRTAWCERAEALIEQLEGLVG